MTPFVLEGRVLPTIGRDPDQCFVECCGPRPWPYELPVEDEGFGPCFCKHHTDDPSVPDGPVRECPLCPPWVAACAHIDGSAEVVFLGIPPDPHDDEDLFECCTGVPGIDDGYPQSDRCSCNFFACEFGPHSYHTEAEARAEFDRRVALLLGREEVSA